MKILFETLQYNLRMLQVRQNKHTIDVNYNNKYLIVYPIEHIRMSLRLHEIILSKWMNKSNSCVTMQLFTTYCNGYLSKYFKTIEKYSEYMNIMIKENMPQRTNKAPKDDVEK